MDFVNEPTIKYVDHTYHDFSRFLSSGGELRKSKKGGKNFPAKVHRMLSDDCNNDVITWMPHGRSFKVLNREELVSRVIPNYFVCGKYESFTRQLNGWGFKRLYQKGPDNGCFYHECFLRAMPELTAMITRVPPKQGKCSPFPDGEPNFEDISKRYPVPLKAKQGKGGASFDSIVSGPKKKMMREKKINAKSAVKTTGEARGKEETSCVPANIHHPVLHEGKPCAEESASKRRDVRQQMSQSRPDNPQVGYPLFEYSRPMYHDASSRHGRYHEHPAQSAQWHGYHQNHHYPGYYYPPAPPSRPPQDASQLHSVATFEDEKAWANFPSPPRTMNEQNTNDGLCQDSGDLYAPISLAGRPSHGGSSDRGAPLPPDDTLEEASRMFLCKANAWRGMIGRDSVSAGGAGTWQGSSFDYP
mmetsp:Transcript_33936/g.81204  ORF Transcript_33936/g.81204 Transcript_33936/m.81204 type:complete len:415 (+) Transcript_33936:307-1551(+)